MKKYAIYVIKGDDKKLISLHHSKEEAFRAGEDVVDELPRKAGLVACMLGDYDEDGNLIRTEQWFYKAWS